MNQSEFMTTEWSLVLTAADAENAEFENSLSLLCQRYWYPLYAFARKIGLDQSSAEDSVQSFFVRLLQKNYIGDADRERGRFRTFLLSSFKNDIAKQRRAKNTLKRGGRVTHISIDQGDAEKRY